jgi:hypothetical protein
MGDLNKRSADVSIHNSTTDAAVTTTTDGSKERLDVDARIAQDTVSGENIAALTTAGYVYCFAGQINMTSSGSDNPLLYIENPTGSGKVLYIYSMRFGVNVSNNYANIKVFANPTITANGTTQTPPNRCIGGGFGASDMNVYTLPTVSANGTQIENLEVAENGNSIHSAENFAMHFEENNKMLVTGDPKSNNREAAITIIWAEF